MAIAQKRLNINWRCSFVPAYRKVFRTVFFIVALGIMTGYIVLEEGSPVVLSLYIMGVLVVYGVDHIRVEYGKLKLELGSEDEHSQTSKDTEDIK